MFRPKIFKLFLFCGQICATDMLASDSAFRAEREKNALQSVDDSDKRNRKVLLGDNLDEIRRVTDTKYIAMTESLHDCLFWDTAALCSAGDGQQASSTVNNAHQLKSCAFADLDPCSEDDCFEIDGERMGHYAVHGAFAQLEHSKLHDQGGAPFDGLASSPVVTRFDRRTYRAWIGAMNLHVL